MIFFAFFCMGTTFVIKEGGVEVGRWEEQDGKDGVEIIDNAAPKEPPKEYKTPDFNTDGVGYRLEVLEEPEGEIKQWKISGQVIDVVRLRGIDAKRITFRGGRKDG